MRFFSGRNFDNEKSDGRVIVKILALKRCFDDKSDIEMSDDKMYDGKHINKDTSGDEKSIGNHVSQKKEQLGNFKYKHV